MITILIAASLTISAFCATVLVCACIVGGRADDRTPQPPVAESWEDARKAEEQRRGVRLVKYFR